MTVHNDVARSVPIEDVNATAPPPAEKPRTNYRWTVCALLFFATTINYVDRQVIGILAPTLQREIGWSEIDYSRISQAFTFAYALGFLGAGRLLDRFGVRRGFSWAIVAWSLAGMGAGLARTVLGFGIARAALGLGESANFPGAIKAVAEWFPKRERAFATGIFNAGTNVGAIVAPLIVPWITLTYGWKWAFILTGSLGFIWLAFWLVLYRSPESHPRVSPSELAHIRSDPEETVRSVPWLKLLGTRQAWAFMIGKMLTDPIWWFYLFWLPKFLDSNFGVRLTGLTAPLVAIYLVADVGSVGGGWVSSALIKRGWSVNAARKTTLLAAALLILPTMFAPHAGSMWGAVAVVSIAAAAHQWWSANLFTLTSDMFPRHAVASVVGLGGFAGAMGGVAFQGITGRVLQADPTAYSKLFIVCGTVYIIALALVHLLVPKLEPAKLEGV
jgi:MFS transporter, ACS family, hexuronate transporter